MTRSIDSTGEVPEHGVSYRAYLNRLRVSSIPESAWLETAAGLVALRAADAWLRDSLSVAGEVAAERMLVERLPASCFVRTQLNQLLDTLAFRHGVSSRARVLQGKWKYARRLEYQGEWWLASDIYESLLPQLTALEGRRRVTCLIRLGYCHRLAASFREAVRAFSDASVIARSIGDSVGMLRARYGLAEVTMVRGNLPRAERMFRRVTRSAKAVRCRSVYARALHGLGNVAYLRHDYETALSFCQRSLRMMTVPELRTRVWGDLSNALMELGAFDLARRVVVMVRSSTEHRFLQWACTYTLLEIHSRLSDLDGVSECAEQLLSSATTPYQRAHGCSLVGECYERLGEREIASAYFKHAAALAAEHGLSQLAFETSDQVRQTERHNEARLRTARIESLSRELQMAETALRP